MLQWGCWDFTRYTGLIFKSAREGTWGPFQYKLSHHEIRYPSRGIGGLWFIVSLLNCTTWCKDSFLISEMLHNSRHPGCGVELYDLNKNYSKTVGAFCDEYFISIHSFYSWYGKKIHMCNTILDPFRYQRTARRYISQDRCMCIYIYMIICLIEVKFT